MRKFIAEAVRPDRTKSIVITFLVVVAATALCIWLSDRWIRDYVYQNLKNETAHNLNLVVANLRGELAKYEALPQLLTINPGLAQFLRAGSPAHRSETMSRELSRMNRISGALDTYLMDHTGLTVAASNWQSEKPFVGQNFSYRPYFQSAMKGEAARFFALGTTSNRRGYYFAFPVRDGGEPLGALVVKARVEHFEANWKSADNEVMVVDKNGVVFLSSEPNWWFKSLHELSDADLDSIRQTRKYADLQIDTLPVAARETVEGIGDIIRLRDGSAAHSARKGPTIEYLLQAADMPEAGWTVVTLKRTRSYKRQILIATVALVLGLLSTFLWAAFMRERHRRIQQGLNFERGVREELERRVKERTAELARTNEQLRGAQDELIRSNRLAALGQLSAGLSHELNQPLTAIHTYVNNVRGFLERNRMSEALAKLGDIVDLTDRMGRIIKHLRTFARMDEVASRPTPVIKTVRDSLDLVRDRIAQVDATVSLNMPEDEIFVQAGEVRLQQVLSNVINNALDSMSDSDERRLEIDIENGGDRVSIRIADTGGGIATEDASRIFEPFFTTKEVGHGLGLGLSIAYAIIERFGGTIETANREEGGAVFTIKLVAAARPEAKAA